MASLVSRIRDVLGRISGVSTPFGGLSWQAGRPSTPYADQLVFTPAECADVLRVDEEVVLELLETGQLRGFQVGDDWRTTTAQVHYYLQSRSQAQEFETFVQQISDPESWAAALREQPDLLHEISSVRL